MMQRSSCLAGGLTIVALVILSYISTINFLLFHVLAEGFSICIAFCIFVVAFNSRKFSENDYLLFIGCSLLFVAFLDLIHTFAYKGMNILGGLSADPATQLWIAARYMESISLLIAPLWLTRKLRLDIAALCYGVVTALVLAAVFWWHVFPDCFLEGTGLTPFKKVSEYIICLILGGALVSLGARRHLMDEKVNKLMALSIGVTILSELSFTFYVSVYGFSNITGHVLKIVSFYLIYKAIIENCLRRPYDTLFRNLEENQKRYQRAQRIGKVGNWEYNLQTTEFWGSDEAKRIYGFDPHSDSFSTEEVESCIPERERVHQALVDLLERDKEYNLEFDIISKDTRERKTIISIAELEKDENGNPFRITGVIQDVTKRRQSELALRKSEAQLHAVFEAADRISFIITDARDPEPLILEFSPGAEKIFEYDRSEMIGKPVSVLHLPEEAAQFPVAHQRMRDGKTGFSGETTLVRKSGRKFPALFSTYPIFDEKGLMQAALGVSIDISEQKELESKLLQAQKMEAIGNLAGGIAHEFNNVLAIILGNAELAMDDVPDWNPARDSLEEIRNASFRAKDVVRQILSFARKSMTSLKPLGINTVVKESLKLMRASIPAMIEIRSDIPTEQYSILGDATEIHQIVINLCTNASYAMKASGGVLEIGISALTLDEVAVSRYEDLSPGHFVKLTVQDSGQGIPSDVLEKVFEPYFTTKEFGAGSGMGLAVVYGVVKKCKGAIKIESAAGQGTTVEVLFPRIEEAPVKAEEEGELPMGNERILLVDDDPSIVNMMRQMLERLGYTVSDMTDSNAALEHFQSAPDEFDLVITDMSMQQMSGDRLAAELMKIRNDVPILLCTGHSDTIDEKKAKALGIRGFAMKPLDKGKLARAVRKILDHDHAAD